MFNYTIKRENYQVSPFDAECKTNITGGTFSARVLENKRRNKSRNQRRRETAVAMPSASPMRSRIMPCPGEATT